MKSIRKLLAACLACWLGWPSWPSWVRVRIWSDSTMRPL